MDEHKEKSFLSGVWHGILSSAVGKALYESAWYVGGGVVVLLIYLAGEKPVLVPGWVVILFVALILAGVLATSIAYWRRKFKLTTRLNSEAFGRAVVKAKSVQILNTFIPNLPDLADELVIALDKGADVEILVLHPKCEEVNYRAATLRRDLGWVEQQIDDTLTRLHHDVYRKTKRGWHS